MIDAVEAADLQRAFQADLRGEARFDPLSRALYSTDASNHQIQPLGVVIPSVDDDLFAIVERAAELDVPLIPRGGGTGLAGQTLGRAVIVDVSKHLTHVHEIDPEAREALVEPGVVCAALNRAAGRAGLQYGPDPASADRATVGGMLGNNATGAHSIRYGMSSDNVLSLDVVLSDGTGATFGPRSLDEAKGIAGRDDMEGNIYRAALDIQQVVRSNDPGALAAHVAARLRLWFELPYRLLAVRTAGMVCLSPALSTGEWIQPGASPVRLRGHAGPDTAGSPAACPQAQACAAGCPYIQQCGASHRANAGHPGV